MTDADVIREAESIARMDWPEKSAHRYYVGMIRALLAERDALKKERDEADERCRGFEVEADAVQRLQATLTRYRNALEQIMAVRLDESGEWTDEAVSKARIQMRDIARAALDGPKEEEA